jgi:hypothetical protein
MQYCGSYTSDVAYITIRLPAVGAEHYDNSSADWLIEQLWIENTGRNAPVIDANDADQRSRTVTNFHMINSKIHGDHNRTCMSFNAGEIALTDVYVGYANEESLVLNASYAKITACDFKGDSTQGNYPLIEIIDNGQTPTQISQCTMSNVEGEGFIQIDSTAKAETVSISNCGVYDANTSKLLVYNLDTTASPQVSNCLIGATPYAYQYRQVMFEPVRGTELTADGYWSGRLINAATENCYFTFYCPDGFEALGTVEVVGIPLATATMDFNFTVDYATFGEDAHSTHGGDLNDQSHACTDNQPIAYDISSLFSSLTDGDFCTVYITTGQANTPNMLLIALRFSYYGR